VAGGVLAFFTAGLSEIPAQLAQIERVAATAAKVRSIIEHLINMARVLAETMSAATAQVVEISRNLKGLLGTRISVATAQEVGQLPELLTTAEQVAIAGLVRAEQAGARVDRVLSRLRPGRRKPNLEVDTSADLDRVWAELSVGGKPINTGFPGIHLELPDGTRVGYRPYSKSGGPVIGITNTDGTVIKVHLP
jgi:ABC-type transporter Mla subunit MlaD